MRDPVSTTKRSTWFLDSLIQQTNYLRLLSIKSRIDKFSTHRPAGIRADDHSVGLQRWLDIDQATIVWMLAINVILVRVHCIALSNTRSATLTKNLGTKNFAQHWLYWNWTKINTNQHANWLIGINFPSPKLMEIRYYDGLYIWHAHHIQVGTGLYMMGVSYK